MTMPDANGQGAGEPCVISGERRRAHAAIHERAGRAARGLASVGIGADDAVALLIRNDIAFLEASLATRLLGAYAVPINWQASAEDVGFILRDCGAKALVAHADLLAIYCAVIPDGLPVVVVATPPEVAAAYGGIHTSRAGASPPPCGEGSGVGVAPCFSTGVEGHLDPRALPLPARGRGSGGATEVMSSRCGRAIETWDAWLARFSPIATPAQAAPSPVIYTSGTTGRPEGVRRGSSPTSHRSERALAVYGLDDPAPMTALINGPMYHSVPNAYARLAFREGATLVLQPRFVPEEMLALVARHRVTHMHIVPAMMVRLLALPDAVKAGHDASSLRHVVHGAAPCPPHVKRAMIDWWGPVIHEYYGSTETGLLTLLGPEEACRKPGAVGRALPGIILAILDPDGASLPPGVVGEVYARSAAGDLVTAGDVGWLDADGILTLCGRKRDRIVVDGIAVYPAEVEAAILAQPCVADCAVFGLPGANGRESVHACVQPAAGHDLDVGILRAGLVARLEARQVPTFIEIVDTLPREDSGKVFKQRLRDARSKNFAAVQN